MELDSDSVYYDKSVKYFPLEPESVQFEPEKELEIEISAILINSDPEECNNNLSLFLKLIVDHFCNKNEKSDSETSINYHGLSIYGIKLLSLNLFTRNYKFCICKLLAFLEKFEELVKYDSGIEGDCGKILTKFENKCFQEFLCIITLLILKMVNGSDVLSTMPGIDQAKFQSLVNREELFNIFQTYNFIAILARFIEAHITLSNQQESLFILLKLCGDIVFEYLYHIELLSDREFEAITNSTNLIETLIHHLVNNDFNNYDIFGDFESEDKFIAYEEFKLLLLINEQYLMKSYSCHNIQNKVFFGLIEDDGPNNRTITGFINLLVFHLNREKSHIIKILILKFFYLIFTTSYTTKLMYLNDLKILVDIFIRELNNIDCTSTVSSENRILMITYLRVIYPMLMFSELSEVVGGYKSAELLLLFRTLVINLSKQSKPKSASIKDEQDELICNLAMRCASVPWLKNCNKKKPALERTSSASSLTSDCDLSESQRVTKLSSSLNKVTSLRVASRSDYHRTVISHNSQLHGSPFTLTNLSTEDITDRERTSNEDETNLLDLPNEYLHRKPLPSLPIFKRNNSSSSSVNSVSQLVLKGMKKKAPPPPRHRCANIKHTELQQDGDIESLPPPPPPPRNRRYKKMANV